MNRALSALAVTIVGVVWVVTFRVTPLQVEAVAAGPTATARREPFPTSAPPGRTLTPTASPAPTTPAASGTFTGTLVSTRYGDVQIRIVVSGQKVIDVQPMTLPHDRTRSAAISQYSAPILRSETIQAQSARIDIVSGATYTSLAYGRSLDAALKLAHLG